MPTEIANFIARTRAPRPADVEADQYTNALNRSRVQMAQNDVARIPQRNQAEDFEMGASQRQNAAGVLAQRFAAVANSPNPKRAAQAFIGGPEFQQAGKIAGLPIEQFVISEQDTDDVIRQQANDWAAALGQGGQTNQNVQSTFVGDNGNMWAVLRDGNTIDTGRRVSDSYQVVNTPGGGSVPVSRRTGEAAPAVVTPQQGTAEAAARVGAETAAREAVPTAEQRQATSIKNVRLEAATRRLERVRAASEAMGGGNPITGRAVELTPKGQELQQANAQLMTELSALTRVPGVGAQSDLEARLNQLQLPTASMYPAVRARAITELEAFMRDLDTAISNVGGQQGAGQQQSIDELLNKYAPAR